MVACLFTGCSIGFDTYEEVLENYNIAAQVTYYSNGGYFNQNTSILSREIEFTTGSKFYNIKEGTGVSEVNRTNYDLVGWYYVKQVYLTETNEDGEQEEVLYFVLDIDDDVVKAFPSTTDANGNTVYYFSYTSQYSTGEEAEDEDDESEELDEDAEIDLSDLTTVMYYVPYNGGWIMSQEDYDYYIRLKKQNTSDTSINVPNLELGDAVDTSITLEDGSHLYVVADWTKSVSINYVLVMKEGETATSLKVTSGGETATVSEGGTLFSEYFGTNSSLTRSDTEALPVTLEDGTLIGYYYDKDCNKAVNGASIAKPTEEDEEGNLTDVTIYAQCISGVWNILRSAADVQTMFGGGSSNYYLLKDIDCYEITVSPMAAFSGIIQGNGYTLSNLKVSSSSLSNNTRTMLFGIIAKGAKISGLTIDGVTITYSTDSRAQSLNIYLIGMAAQNTEKGDFDISGLTLKNVDMTVTLATYSNNETGYTMIRNIQYINGVYEDDNWLYGSMTDYVNNSNGVDYLDSDFTTTYGGATIQGYTLKIVTGGTTTVVASSN